MNVWAEELKKRTWRFALDVIAFNYRSACRSRPHAEFSARLGVVLEESDEAEGWLDLIRDAKIDGSAELDRLRDESKALRAIFAKACLTSASPPLVSTFFTLLHRVSQPRASTSCFLPPCLSAFVPLSFKPPPRLPV